jgi:hypothetical protein
MRSSLRIRALFLLYTAATNNTTRNILKNFLSFFIPLTFTNSFAVELHPAINIGSGKLHLPQFTAYLLMEIRYELS